MFVLGIAFYGISVPWHLWDFTVMDGEQTAGVQLVHANTATEWGMVEIIKQGPDSI